MQHLEVSGAGTTYIYIYIYIIRQLRVNPVQYMPVYSMDCKAVILLISDYFAARNKKWPVGYDTQ